MSVTPAAGSAQPEGSHSSALAILRSAEYSYLVCKVFQVLSRCGVKSGKGLVCGIGVMLTARFGVEASAGGCACPLADASQPWSRLRHGDNAVHTQSRPHRVSDSMAKSAAGRAAYRQSHVACLREARSTPDVKMRVSPASRST